jgi:hypothetical protein
MTDTQISPTIEEWRALYEVFQRVAELAPWLWMNETQIFGVQNPDTDEPGFVSVMGQLGEHLAIAVYLGPEALGGFWGLQRTGGKMTPEQFFSIAQLQASLEDRQEVRKEDREIMKRLGLKFRGAQSWPLFRSFRPAHLPWFLEAPEARFLIHALGQVIEVAPRFQKNPTLGIRQKDQSYLIRVPRREGHQFVWEDNYQKVPATHAHQIKFRMDMSLLNALKRAGRVENQVQADLFMVDNAPIHEKGARPYFPYMLMMVEAKSGHILGNELLSPKPSLDEMWGQVPYQVARQLSRLGVVPREIAVRSDWLAQLLSPLAEELDFKVIQPKKLKALDQAKDEFLSWMERRF